MNRSESIGKLATALSKAQGAMDDASKDSTNPHFKSKYADLASVRAAARKPLSDNGLAYMQMPRFNGESGEVEVETILMHGESGEFISETLCIPVGQRTAHAIGSAITYGRRFSLMAALGIAPDEDDDGNRASEGADRAPPRQQWKTRAPTQEDNARAAQASKDFDRLAKKPDHQAPLEPIGDEIPHMEPSPAQQAAALAKTVTDSARQSAAATASVAKMAADASMPVDPKAAAVQRAETRRKADEDLKARGSAEVLENLRIGAEQIDPKAKNAREQARWWDSTRKVAKLNDQHKLDAFAIGCALMERITKAEKLIAPGAFRPGLDDPLPEHDENTGELRDSQ